MVLSFFKGSSGEGDFAPIVTRAVTMLGDARHSFDLASMVLLTDAEASSVADDVRATDERINQAEQELRSELVVHVAVQGTADIGSVLGFTLLLKKVERIGDQAKNILELAEQGVSFADSSERERLFAERQELSALFAEAAELLNASRCRHRRDHRVHQSGKRCGCALPVEDRRVHDVGTTRSRGRTTSDLLPLPSTHRRQPRWYCSHVSRTIAPCRLSRRWRHRHRRLAAKLVATTCCDTPPRQADSVSTSGSMN